MNLSFLEQSSRMIRTILTIKRESSSLLSPRMNLSFVGPWSTMNQDHQLRWSKVSEIHFSLSNRMNLSFVDSSSTMIFKLSSIEGHWNSLLSSSDKSLSFPDQSSAMFWTILSIVSKWNLFRSPLTKSLCFLDPPSRWFEQYCRSTSECNWLDLTYTVWISAFPRSMRRQCFCQSRRSKVSGIHFSVSSRKPLSFLDPWSTMFCTFWLMERRMGSPLPSTKLS